MDLSRVNSVASFIPTKKLKDLKSDRDFKITQLRETQTQFGKRIIAELNDEFAVFLPARILGTLDEEETLHNKMKKAAEKGLLALKYISNKYSKIEFKNL